MKQITSLSRRYKRLSLLLIVLGVAVIGLAGDGWYQTTTEVAFPVHSVPIQGKKTLSGGSVAPIASAAPTSSAAASSSNVASSSGAVHPGSATPHASAPPAATSATPPKTTSPPASPPPPQPPAITRTPNYTSSNWAGYVAATGSYTGISASWTVPSSTRNGSSTSADASWIGIGGLNSSDLIQIGTANTVDGGNGKVSTYVFYEMVPSAAVYPSLSVAVGDHIAASLTQTADGVWNIALTDTTNGQSFSKTVSYSSGHSSAEWIEEDPTVRGGSLAPFDYFGQVSFAGASVVVNGTSQSIAGSEAGTITMVSKTSGSVLASPSGLTGGTGFTVTRSNAAS